MFQMKTLEKKRSSIEEEKHMTNKKQKEYKTHYVKIFVHAKKKENAKRQNQKKNNNINYI